MRRSSDDVPPELSHVPKQALEGYVRRRLLGLANMPCVAKSLNCPSEVICQALIQALEMGHLEREDSDPSQPGAAEWQLVFRHDCLNQGCPDMACRICAENPNRRCRGNFADKYLAGDVLKATCGAPIRVEIINRTTGDSASKQEYEDVLLEVLLYAIIPIRSPSDPHTEMYILDGKAFAGLEESGQQHSEHAVDECMLLANNQGKVLLATDRNGEHNKMGMVLLHMHPTAGHSVLPGLNVTGSSEAILSGQKPPFRLLVRAMGRDNGARLSNIRFAVSEPFVVATQRTRTASKALIPSLSDPVGKLNGLGGMTVKKLLDLGHNVRESRSSVLSEVPLESASTVEEFKFLILWAEEVPQRVEELKKVLRLNQNYLEARDHAMLAVGKDNRLRFWTNANVSHAGALFSANLGSIELDHPAALLEREGSVVRATLPNYLSCNQKEVLRRVQNEARKHWWREGHPGWGIWEPMDEDTLHKTVHAQVGTEGCMRLPSNYFPEGVLNPIPRNTHSFGGFPSLSDKGSSGLMGLNALRNASGGAFSRPNLVFNTAQPQLQISTNPPAAAMPSALWPQRFPGSSSPPSNLYMPSIPEPDQAAPLPVQNGHGTLDESRNSDLMPSLGHNVMPSASESLLKPSSFRRDRPPPPSPFAEEEPQSSDGTAANSASQGHDYSSLRDKQPLLSQRESEGDRHRSKRANVQAGQLQQKMSALMGRPLGSMELRAIFPSFSAQMPGSAFSGLPQDVSLVRPIQQAEAAAQQNDPELQAPPVSTPPASATTSGDRQQRSRESSVGVSNPGLNISLSQADIPDLDMDDFVGFLTNDRELNPEESDHFKSLFSGRLAGIDDPLPSMMLGGSRQGSALQSGFSYGQLLHKGSEMGNSRPSSGLDNMSSLEEAMLGATSRPQA